MTTTLDEVKNFIYSGKQNVEHEFDKYYQERLEDIYFDLARLFEVIDTAHDDESSLNDASLIATGILWNALQGIFVAVQTLRSGNWKEACVLLRTSHENSAVALYLHNNPTKFSDYMSGKIRLGTALQQTKKLVRGFEGECDMLSEIFVHPSPHYGINDFKQGRFVIGSSFNKEKIVRYAFALFNVEKALINVGIIIELMFFKYARHQKYWRRTEGRLAELPLNSKYFDTLFDVLEMIEKEGNWKLDPKEMALLAIIKKVAKARRAKEVKP